jgi:hypothetical protein
VKTKLLILSVALIGLAVGGPSSTAFAAGKGAKSIGGIKRTVPAGPSKIDIIKGHAGGEKIRTKADLIKELGGKDPATARQLKKPEPRSDAIDDLRAGAGARKKIRG